MGETQFLKRGAAISEDGEQVNVPPEAKKAIAEAAKAYIEDHNHGYSNEVPKTEVPKEEKSTKKS